MKKNLFQNFLILIAVFTCCSQIYAASSGTNGTVTLTVSDGERDATELNVNVGTEITLTANVSSITNGSNGGSNGSVRYTINIPKHLIDGSGNELETDSVIENNVSSMSGNGRYEHGRYTGQKAGSYVFAFDVSTGNKGGEEPVVHFHPLAPTALPATAINPLGFTANWTNAEGSESYVIQLENEDSTLTISGITDLFYEFTGLLSSTEYSYTIKSEGAALYSLESSELIPVSTPVRPVLMLETETLPPFANFVLGSENTPTQNISITSSDLYDDISFTLGIQSVFSVSESIIDKDTESKSVIIGFNPTFAGQYRDTLIISSLYAETVRIPLEGSALIAAPQVLAATDESSSAFTANWERSLFAESYILTVLDENTNPLEGYNNLNVGDTTAHEVLNLLPNSTYTYTLKAVNNGVSSDPSNTITVTTADGPVITYSQISAFSQEVNTSTTKTIRIKGTNLTEGIILSLSGEYFDINENELNAEGGSVVVSYTPTAVGAHEALLTLSSTAAQDVIISLKGTSVPLPTTILPATEIGLSSFTANWSTTSNASDYLLTVKQGDEMILADESTAGATSLLVSSLASGKTYTYSVKVIENGQVSAASDIAETYTHSAPLVAVYPEKTAIRVKWNSLPGIVNCKVTLYEDETPLEAYNEIVVTQSEYFFTGLQMNSHYYLEITSVYTGGVEYSSGKIAIQTMSDYGAQLRNSGFEYWEGAETSIEPTNWNSFMTGAGSMISMAKAQKVDESDLTRDGSKGEKSVVIWSNSVLGIVANGNLTTGQIQANSATATNLNNHNKTIIDNDDFRAPFTGTPDSLSVWVKFVPKNGEHQARVSAVLHDNYEYRDPANSEAQAHEIAKAELDYSAAEDNSWQRLSIPFEYTENDLTSAYMLVSFTTNKTPGVGSANDSVYVDDILMIYKPTLAVGQPNKTKYVLGEKITIPYTITGTMSPSNLEAEANIVSLELSDENGSFENSQVIAQLTTDNSGELTASLPDEIALSTNYRVRVTTTNYPMISEESAAFAIRQMPNVPLATAASDITAASFVANWQAVEGASGYLLIVGEQEIEVDGGETLSYEVKNLTPETNYSYTVKTIVDDLYSEVSNTIHVTTKDGGSIIYNGTTSILTNVGVIKTEILSIVGEGLIENIYIDFIENENGYFAINENELTTSGDIEISYNPTEIGVHSAKLRFQSTFVDNVVVSIIGIARPFATNTIVAEDITPMSFVANWEATTEAEAYLLTVLDSDRNVFGEYSNLNVGTETSYLIDGLAPETDYYYTVKVSAQNIESEISNETTVNTLKKPLIAVSYLDKEFLLNVGSKDVNTITLGADNLFGGNEVNIQLIGSEHFSIDKATVNNEEEIIVSYQPTEAGAHSATITLTAEYADALTIELIGTAYPLPVVALSAQDITLTSFVACWEAATDADTYLLTVKNNTGNIVGDYDRKNTGNVTAVEITGLQRLRDYIYYVEVMKNSIVSEVSNTIAVRTATFSSLNAIHDENLRAYPNPAKDVIFVEGIRVDAEYAIINAKGILMQKGSIEGSKIRVENLQSGIYIIKIGEKTLSFIKE